jgi:hypothetical protein
LNEYAMRIDRYITAREGNVLRVDFWREPDPPAPKFPGAGALRSAKSNDGIATGKAA